VAVIDSGIDYTHPDLAANMYTNPGEIPDNGVDDDRNGFVDDVRGWDFRDNDNDPMDNRGHGTHVAGTIGAVGNNGIGVTGVAWEVTLVPLRFIGRDGLGTSAGAIEAIDYAIGAGVDIINASWGTPLFSQPLLESITEASDAGILFVTSAGNAGIDADVIPHYPSGFDVPAIVAVAATDHNDSLASFSNYGALTVDLAAPGVSTLSTFPFDDYGRLSGTSMASPHVAGTAALVLAVAPGLDALSLKDNLLASVDAIPDLAGRLVSGGRLNAFRALSSRETVPPGACTDLAVSSPGSFSLVLTWTATGDDGDSGTASRYDIRYSTSPFDESGFASAVRVERPPRPLAAGSRQSLEIRGLASRTTYYFALQAIDDWGNAGPMSALASGTTLDPPDIGADPAGLFADLFTNQIATRLLAIGNTGAGDLEFGLEVAPGGWLTVDPASGIVPPGGSQNVVVTLNAAGLSGGDYGTDLVISSNDPDEPAVVVPVRLHVVDAPDITLTASRLDFGALFVGAPRGLSLTVRNDGRAVLSADLATNHMDFSVSPASLDIPAGGSGDVLVTFRPSLPVTLQGVLTLQTNDPDEGTATVSLSGTGLVPPDIALSPAALNVGVLSGETVARTVTLENTGGSALRFRTVIRPAAPSARTPGAAGPLTPGATALVIQSVKPYQTTSNEQILSDHGILYDSIGPGRVASIDLSAYPLVIVSGDQPESYYDILRGQAGRLNAYVAQGGILEVHAASHGLTDGQSSVLTLPGGVGIQKSLAWITWILQQAHPLAAGVTPPIVSNTFTSHCQFTNPPADVVRVARNEHLQPVLIVYRHGSGMVVAGCQPFEAAHARNEPAGIILNNMIRYAHGLGASWLSVDPARGTVPVGRSVELAVRFDATGRLGGAYDADVLIASDDPDESMVAIPAHLQVTGIPDVHASPAMLDFGLRDVGLTVSRFVTIGNSGTDVLTARVESDSDQFPVPAFEMAVAPGESRTVSVTFTPSRPGLSRGILRIRSNDPDEEEIGVLLSGIGRLSGLMEVAPASLEMSLLSGDTGTRSLSLRNAGAIDLAFTIPPVVSSWLSAAPRSGFVPPGASLDILVGFDGRVAHPGTHQTALIISSTDPNRSILAVPVTFNLLADSDWDRIPDQADNCAFASNPLQEDSDQDLRGDACDNCPTTSNAGQGNQDSDGRGDACDNCPDVPNSGQEDADRDLHGDPCDNCPSAANPDQADGTRDGFGDACQPELLLRSVLQDGGETLEVRAEARDPQGDPLAGRMEILGGHDVVLQDMADTLDCGRGYSPRGEPGRGIAFASMIGDGGLPVLIDLDSALGCEDGFPDFLFAAGPCGDALAQFETTLSLASLLLPAAICVRHVDGSGDELDLRVLRHDQETIALLFGIESVLQVHFADRLPRQAVLPGLQSGTYYWLEIETTDGSTAPVRTWTRFLYQGETRIVINNPPLSSPSAPAVGECDRQGGAVLTLDGTASRDPDSAPGTLDDLVEFVWLLDPGLPMEHLLGSGPVLTVTIPLGVHEVGLRLTRWASPIRRWCRSRSSTRPRRHWRAPGRSPLSAPARTVRTPPWSRRPTMRAIRVRASSTIARPAERTAPGPTLSGPRR
jgi:hypothetical protein